MYPFDNSPYKIDEVFRRLQRHLLDMRNGELSEISLVNCEEKAGNQRPSVAPLNFKTLLFRTVLWDIDLRI